ncbi:MAG: hypothetical protein Q7Q73_15010 [Verrucomicrobiota bacterium JB024]|nr:hypothetical protein [Verrucomicrobiota bacterium JB024]
MKKWILWILGLLVAVCLGLIVLARPVGCYAAAGQSQTNGLTMWIRYYGYNNDGQLPRFWRDLYLYDGLGSPEFQYDLTRRFAWLPELPRLPEGRVLLATARPFEEHAYSSGKSGTWCYLIVVDDDGEVENLRYSPEEFEELVEKHHLRIPPVTPYAPDAFERQALAELGERLKGEGVFYADSGINLMDYVAQARRENAAP